MSVAVANRVAGKPFKAARPPLATITIIGTALVSLLCSAVSPSALTILLCGAALCAIVALLWQEREPPILLLPVLFQWSEVSIQAYATAWRGTPLNQASPYGADLESATLYGLLGVMSLGVGMRLASRSTGVSFAQRLRSEARVWSFDRIALLSATAVLGGHFLALIGRFSGGAGQIFLAASNLQVVGLFAFCYWCLVRNEKLPILAAVVGFEILIGMTGFFAAFKDTILALFVAAIAAKPRIRPLDVVTVGAAGIVVLAVATFWTAVKPGYRELLNQGSGAQEVTVPVGQRLEYLWSRAMTIDAQGWADGFEALVDRHGYTNYLGMTMSYVPAARPHENGQLTVNMLTHIAVPRVIYPNKPALPSDTDVTALYTGLDNTWDANTSISIGYLGELYIDFGWIGGLVAAGCIGALVGFVYRAVRDRGGTSALAAGGFCVMAVLPIAYFGTAYTKLMGSFVMTAAVIIVMQRLVVPRVMPILMSITRP